TIRRIMTSAGEEKSEDPSNQTVAVVAAIAALVLGPELDRWTSVDRLDRYLEGFTPSSEEIAFTATDVVNQIKAQAGEERNSEWPTPKKIGLIISKDLRLPTDRAKKKPRPRHKMVSQSLALDLLRAYGLLPKYLSNPSTPVQPVQEQDTDAG